MDLRERDGELEALEAALAAARDGHGRVVLVGGEAGIGKTRLVQTFTDRHEADAAVLWGACDDLSTPRPLGPFKDIASQAGGAIEEALASNPARSTVFDLLLDTLDRGVAPKLVVVEDVHWADAATFDVIKFIGRRIERLGAMLIVTYRTEDPGALQRLRVAVGDIPAAAVVRLTPGPLSRRAVAAMAETYAGSADDLYVATGGNPFLVTEALSVPGKVVPASVRDAVASRLARLSPNARDVAAAAAMVPGQVERWLLGEMTPTDDATLEECRARGLVEYDDWIVWYRHELVRGAVRDAVPADHRRALDAGALAALVQADGDLARIVHHARGAGDRDALARYAPRAARQASEASSHREALAHFRVAVDHADLLDPADRAQLLLDYASEAFLMNEAVEGLGPAEEALALWRALGDREEEGRTLRWISRLHWWLGQSTAAERFGLEAIEVLEELPDSKALPMAYSNLAQLCMLAQRADPAIHWATKAIASARRAGDQATLAHALNNLGSTRARAGDLEGLDLLRESLALSLDEGLEDHAGRAYANLIWTLLDYRSFIEAAPLVAEALEYAVKRELPGAEYYLRAERARLRLATGDWPGAEADVEWVMTRPEEPGITRMPAMATRAQLHVRRGDSDAASTVELARHLAEPTGELQRTAPVSIATAELSWLNGDAAGAASAVRAAHDEARAAGQPWIVDELAFWLWRGGAEVVPPESSDTPYVAQIAGDWQTAAEAWERLGCPYERATALLDGDEPRALLTALEILDDLGAQPAARLVRDKLRSLGVANVPRGPRPQTRANPGGLTNRQIDVLRLLAEGLTNAEIAERLFVSPKTVDHHVSAVLTKLDVGSRHEAVDKAAALGIFDET